MTSDKEGSLFCSITLKRNYKNRTLDILKSGYVKKQLQKYNYPKPMKLQHCLWEPNPKRFGANTKEPLPEEKSPH